MEENEFLKSIDKRYSKTCKNIKVFFENLRVSRESGGKFFIFCDSNVAKRFFEARLEFENAFTVSEDEKSCETVYNVSTFRQALKDADLFYEESLVKGMLGSAVQYMLSAYEIRVSMPNTSFSTDERMKAFMEIFLKLGKLLFALNEMVDGFMYCVAGYQLCNNLVDCSDLNVLLKIYQTILESNPTLYKKPSSARLPHEEPFFARKLKLLDSEVEYSSDIYKQRVNAFIAIEKNLQAPKLSQARNNFKNFLELYMSEVKEAKQKAKSADSKRSSKVKTPKFKAPKKGKPSKKATALAKHICHDTSATNESMETDEDAESQRPINTSVFADKNKFSVLTLTSKTAKKIANQSETPENTSDLTPNISQNELADNPGGPWQVSSSRKFTTGSSPEIRFLMEYLKDIYNFCWACPKFTECRYGERVIVQHSSDCKQCPGNVLLCHPKTEKGDWLIKVRVPLATVASGGRSEHKICIYLVKNKACPMGDACHFAHSDEELAIWNIIHDSNVDAMSIFTELKGFDYAPPLLTNMIPKAVTIVQNRPNFIPNRPNFIPCTSSGAIPKTGTKAERVFQQDQATLSTAEMPLNSANSITLEVVNLSKASPLMDSHKFHLACLNCHVITTNEINVTSHHCDRNIILCREKLDKRLIWQRVRPKPPLATVRQTLTQFPICRDFPRCPRSLRCTSAHSELERSIWNRELKDNRILIPNNLIDFLYHCLTLKSHRTISLPNFKNGVYVWVGCQACFTIITKGYCQLFKFNHDCRKDVLLCREGNWKHQFWVIVRPKTPGFGKYELCCHVEKNDCWEWRTCKFAHSEFEHKLWQMDDNKKSRQQIDLTKIIGEEIAHWRTEGAIAYKIVQPKPVIMNLQQPTSLVSSARSSFDSGNQENNENPFGYLSSNTDRKRKRPSPTESSGSESVASPYRVHYICGICYFRYKKISYQRPGNSGKCEHIREPHDFHIHRRLMIFADNGKAYDIRRLPDFLLSKKAKSTSICKTVAEGKACKREVCYFAHSEIERRCWTFLLRNNKDVFDIVTEPLRATPAPQSSVGFAPLKNAITRKDLPTSAVWGSLPNTGFVEIEAIKGLQDDALYCFLCEKRFSNETKFEEHCLSSVEHDEKLDIDQQREWTCRPPRCRPPFKLCKKHLNNESCIYSKSESNFCSDAHSNDELQEWNERLTFLQQGLALSPPSEDVVAVKEKMKLSSCKPGSIITMKSNSNVFPFASIDLNGTPVVGSSSENREKKFQWSFTIDAEVPLKRAALVDKQFVFYFHFLTPTGGILESSACDGAPFRDENVDRIYEVKVEFGGSKSLGTFTQEVIFDFGDELPMVRQYLTVNVGISEMQLQHLSELRDLLTPSDVWTDENSEIHWISKPKSHNPLIKAVNPSEVIANLHLKLNEQTYFKTMRKLIIAEEMRRQAILSSFRVKAKAFLGQQLPGNREDDPPRIVQNRLIAQVPLDFELSEDFDVSELLTNDCEYAFIAVPEGMAPKSETGKRHIYEVEVVSRKKFNYEGFDKGCIFLCLSSSFAAYFRLKSGDTVPLEIQFNLSRTTFKPFSRCLTFLERKQMAHFVFPNLVCRFNSYFTGKVAEESKSKISQLVYLEHKWKNSDNNAEQIHVIRHVVSCATNKTHWIPPMVIYGPFGTGKTRTMSQAVCTLLGQPNLEHTKILICTQSNTTADLYLKHLEIGSNFNTSQLQALIWRLFPSHTVVDNLPLFIKPYVRLTQDNELEKLTLEKLKTVRVVICTTSGVNRLVKLMEEKPDVSFTHIFMDEAAQAFEVEMLQPLCVANNMTCVVIAGDHHQIRPTAYFTEAEELQYSYLERLFKSYDDQEKAISDAVKPSCHIPKVLFTKNYRCHPDILAFLAESFYEGGNLTACASVPENDLKAMYFAMAVGREQILPGGISYSNCNEVDEIVHQVDFFYDNWPQSFGDKDIGIITGSHDQVKLVKEQLKAKRYYGRNIQIGKAIHMQGKEFKVLIVSTVRGRNLFERPVTQRRKMAFLDDDRLINTAITRARYCVVVVGDPIVLCSVGKCKNIWRRYIDYCFSKKSFLPERYSEDQFKMEMLITEARLNSSAQVNQNVLFLASQAVNQMSGFSY